MKSGDTHGFVLPLYSLIFCLHALYQKIASDSIRVQLNGKYFRKSEGATEKAKDKKPFKKSCSQDWAIPLDMLSCNIAVISVEQQSVFIFEIKSRWKLFFFSLFSAFSHSEQL